MRIRLLGFKRSTYLMLAVALSLAAVLPVLRGHAAAYVQLTARSIELSSSAAGATGQSYLVTFTPTTAAKNVRIDFCSNSPLFSDSCTPPTSMDASGATFTNGSGFSGWAIATGNNASGNANTGASFVTINNASAFSTGSSINYTLGNIKNPTTTGTFYARIYTYVAQSNDYGANATLPGTVADFGGIALSTANLISITAKVQETLTFCVSGISLSPSSDCTSATTPTLTLGHGTPAVLDQTTTDTASAFMQASTNANAGVSIRMKSSNSCANAGLSSNGGSTCNIPGQDNTAASAITPGTAAFGLYVADSTTSTTTTPAVTGTGTVTPDGNYHNASHTNIGTGDLWYGMDNTSGSGGVTSTFGDPIATSSAPLSLVNNQLVFGATASLTTQAGIYTVNESLICTGTF
ncbi:MAG TPA: hypothetical protein VLF91_04835 [Candidatus Saccharimonadales bacterium]|nr:hypothetical protein [Candidatus Saccharimonadales bacterium]